MGMNMLQLDKREGMAFLISVGDWLVRLILTFAGYLKDSHIPGWVALAFLISLLVLVIWLYTVRGQQCKALEELIKALEADTSASQEQRLKNLERLVSQKHKSRTDQAIAGAWNQYRATLLPVADDSNTTTINSTVRSSDFFNINDLGFDTGFWRMWPGLFVSIGLFFTFLGLIAALNTMTGLDSEGSQALENLLKIASAKFIMSLVGLLCSIVFTWALTGRNDFLERQIGRLNAVLEFSFPLTSIEFLNQKQLQVSLENREYFQRLGTELVAELGRPLREELPQTISTAITSAMQPVIEQVVQTGSQGVGGMVERLSESLSNEVGAALDQASERFALAGDQMGALMDRIDASGSRMSTEMERAVQQLAESVANLQVQAESSVQQVQAGLTEGTQQLLVSMDQTLDAIRQHTAENASIISQAANTLLEASQQAGIELQAVARQGGENLEEDIRQISEQGRLSMTDTVIAMSGSLAEAAERIGEATGRAYGEIGDGILGPLKQISENLEGTVTHARKAGSSLSEVAGLIEQSSLYNQRASTAFDQSASRLADATIPIMDSIEHLSQSTLALQQTHEAKMETISQAMINSARQSEALLDLAQQVLGGQQQAVEATLGTLKGVVEELAGQGDRLDDVDERLGRVFEQYRLHVDGIVDSLVEHVRQINQQITPALDTLQAIVEQAEQFQPAQMRP